MKGAFVALFFLGFVFSFDYNDYLGTKSAYVPGNGSFSPLPPQCPTALSSASFFNFVARHGARNPTNGDIKKFATLQQTLQKYGYLINAPPFDWMKNWTSPFCPICAGALDLIGLQEHYNLSKRIEKRYNLFSNLHSSSYVWQNFPIRTTQVPRAARSGNAFGAGLFEGKGEIGPGRILPFYQFSESEDQDIQLRFFDNCHEYTKLITDNETFWKMDQELYLKQKGPIIWNNIMAKLGIVPTEWPYDESTLTMFWKGCGFDVSMRNDETKFCQLFSEEDAQNLEFADDLSDYWIKGYGNSINYQMACPLLKDFFDDFDSVAKGSTQKASLRFAHAETILPFTALLGLAKDDFQLRWDNSPSQIKNRKWRSSLISPFAANFAMIMVNCTNEWRVTLFHNEEQKLIPGCAEMYCPLETLRELWKEPLNCDFAKLCNVSSSVCPDCPTCPEKPGKSSQNESTTVKVESALLILFGVLLIAAVFGIILYSVWKKKHANNTNRDYQTLAMLQDDE